jgi:putative serine protease PepD
MEQQRAFGLRPLEPPGAGATPPPQRRPWRALLAGMLAAMVALTLCAGVAGGLVVRALDSRKGTATTAAVPSTATAPDTTAGSRGGSSAGGSSGTTRDTQAVARVVLPAVVELQVSSAGQQGTGSGVVLRSDGYILTNAHVVEGATRITVTLQSGERLEAELVGSDATDDLAVVRVAKSGLKAATFGRSASLAVGQRVVAVGSSFGLEGSVTEGIVSALHRVVLTGGPGQDSSDLIDAIQTDAAINPGNSGGALADDRGRVIGITSAIESSSGANAGVGFAIPSDRAVQVANQLVAGRQVTVSYLGVTGGAVDDDSDGQGARIQEVSPGSPAADARLQAGDLVTRVGDRIVRGWEDLVLAIRELEAGSTAEVRVLRGDAEQTLRVTVGSRPVDSP